MAAGIAQVSAQVWESALESVVVYARGALCRRRARGVVPADGRVRVAGLPRSLGHGSLRARVLEGPGGAEPARVTGARVEVAATLRTEDELPELHRREERLERELDAAVARRDRLRARIAEVAALSPVPPNRRRDDPPHRRTPADAWLELADFVDDRLAALHERAARLDEEVELAEHAHQVALDELIRASSAARTGPVETAGVAALTVAGAAGAELEVEVEYLVPGALWVPTYQLSHRTGEATGRLVLRASVAQRTGEDWTGVRLALSTADADRGSALPKLRSLRIGRRQAAPVPSGWREQPPGLADLFTGYEAAGPGPQPAAAFATLRVGGAPPPPPRPAAARMPSAPGGAPAPVAAAAPAPSGPSGPPQAYGGGMLDASRDEMVMSKRSAHVTRGFAAAPAAAAPAFGAPPAQPMAPPPPPGPPQPSRAQLDYATLVLAGADEQAGQRGRLVPGPPADPGANPFRAAANELLSLPLPAHAVSPRLSAGSFDQRYDAAAPADIPSDGTWHTVTVAELPLSLHTEYVCVPAVEEAVYATLVLANPTERALLAGPVEVGVDGDFLLTAALPTLAPGGTRRVGLGQAEGVRVARRAELRESTAGMLNSTTVLEHRVHVELANRLSAPVTVEVRERVPVSSEPDVRIEEKAGWTAPAEATEEYPPSTRIWRVELAAGASAELDGGFDIRIPAGKALVGGNRRS